MRLLQAVVRAEGITALVATHDAGIVDLSDEVLTLEDGRLDAAAAPVRRPGSSR
jgi:putative ABC transport system ATP-binding protein